ncbi:MAG: hypothetical protein ACLVFA_09750 [Butyricicoccus sp.]
MTFEILAASQSFYDRSRPRDAQVLRRRKHYVGHLRMDRLFHQRSAADPI